MCELIEKLCYDYLKTVYLDINIGDNLDNEDLKETFLFEATNNFKEGEYDIYSNNLDGFKLPIDIDKLIKDNVFDMIKYINTYFEDNYGEECILKWKEYDEKYLLRNFCYVYSHSKIDDIIKDLKTDLT
tara:strand:- start:73 stop:459 length:387 start_codon:yes stop_codon:yes gene_type:complete